MLSLRLNHVAVARGGVKNNISTPKFTAELPGTEDLGKAGRALVEQVSEQVERRTGRKPLESELPKLTGLSRPALDQVQKPVTNPVPSRDSKGTRIERRDSL